MCAMNPKRVFNRAKNAYRPLLYHPVHSSHVRVGMQLTRRGCGAMLALLPWSRPPARAEPLPLACPGAWRPTDSGCVRTCVDSVDLAVLRPRRMHVHVPAVRAYQPAYRVPEALGSSLGAARTSRARVPGPGVPSAHHTPHRTAHGATTTAGEQPAVRCAQPERRAAAVRGRARARVRATPCVPARQAGTRTPPCNHAHPAL